MNALEIEKKRLQKQKSRMPKINNLSYTKFSLHKALANVVKEGWIMKSQEVAQSNRDLLIADGYPEIIFVLNGAYCKEALNAKKEIAIINKSCLVGIQNQSIFASRINSCHLIGLKLYPWGAYQLFGEKLKNTADKNIAIEKFGTTWLSDLNKKLTSNTTKSKIIELVSDAISQQINKSEKDNKYKLAEAYLRSILSVGGKITVEDLAKQHCLSIHHFQRKFKQYYGISPKKFINIIRFKELYKSSVLQNKVPDNFLEFGYYDQMHFIKDFRKQLGITPSKTTDKAFLKLNKIAEINS